MIFLDKLFDSVNGSFTAGKDFKKLVSQTSKHMEFWRNAITPANRHIINSSIRTLNGDLELRQILLKLEFKAFSAQSIDQDPIVYFFAMCDNMEVETQTPLAQHLNHATSHYL